MSIEAKWDVVGNGAEFEEILGKVGEGEKVIIDVYGEWCVGCEGVEKEVIGGSDVERGLENVVGMKLDLREYDGS